MSNKQSPRPKQQKEWDRPSVILAVIAAASASALAITSPLNVPNISWLSTACFSAAFGLSLEGLILITYLTVFASSSGSETLGGLSSGRLFNRGLIRPIAFVTALPIALTTYASFFLLVGLLSMTIAHGIASDIQSHKTSYKVVVLAPICVALVSVVAAIAGCETVVWKEAQHTGKVIPKGEKDGFDEEKVALND
ncbi:hypothetical protein FRC08_017832 [Ceratobasidium sp. 394]|nr:hypothetical protein FRC08_017832 [Ceratobasidium sp. 394]